MLRSFTAAELHDKGLDAISRLASSKLCIVAAVGLMLMLLSSSAFAAGEGFGGAFNEATGTMVSGIGCALKGSFGWILIAIGVLLALWDYFIQKQGHFLVLAMVGVMVVIILGQVLPSDNC